MSTFVLKKIEFDLSSRSINNAIRDVKRLQRQLRNWVNDLIRQLVEDGVVVAKMNVMSMNAVYTGALEDSIQGVFFPEERIGVIFTTVPYALFVEYGTGIVGAESKAETGPLPEGYEHDYNHHGDQGWWYFLETDGINQFRWTRGMPARPYMYQTLKWLEENAGRVAGGMLPIN